MHLPGVYFEPVTIKPFYGEFKDQLIKGSQIYYTDRDKVNLCNLAVQILYKTYRSPGVKMFRDSPDGNSGPAPFDHIAGGSALRVSLQTGETPEQIITSWQPGLPNSGRTAGLFSSMASAPRARLATDRMATKDHKENKGIKSRTEFRSSPFAFFVSFCGQIIR